MEMTVRIDSDSKRVCLNDDVEGIFAAVNIYALQDITLDLHELEGYINDSSMTKLEKRAIIEKIIEISDQFERETYEPTKNEF